MPRPLDLGFDPIRRAAQIWAERFGSADAMAAATSVMRVQQLLLAQFDAICRPHGLTFARYEALVLLTFSRTGALPMAKIGERLMVHPTSVTNTVQRLEAAGFVARNRTPRRARTLARVTEQGREVVDKVTGELMAVTSGSARSATSERSWSTCCDRSGSARATFASSAGRSAPDPGVRSLEQGPDVAGQPIGEDVGNGGGLEHVAQARPDRDPDVGERGRRSGVRRVLGGDAAYRGEWSFRCADDVGEPDRRRVGGEPVAARGPSLGFEQAGPAQIAEDGLEELSRDLLRLGDLLPGRRGGNAGRELDHRAHGIVGPGGHMHDRIQPPTLSWTSY